LEKDYQGHMNEVAEDFEAFEVGDDELFSDMPVYEE